MFLRIRLSIVDHPMLVIDAVTIVGLGGRSVLGARCGGIGLRVGVVTVLLRSGVLGVLVCRATICRFRRSGSARHASIVRRAHMVLVVKLLFGDDCVAASESTRLLIVMLGLLVALEEAEFGALGAFAGGVVVVGGGAVFLLLLVLLHEENGHDGGDEEEEATDYVSCAQRLEN